MNWYKIKTASVIGYHATRADFDEFNLSFAKDELGMQMGEGYGHNKFYFAKSKDRAFPQVGEGQINLITAQLNIQEPFDGNEYTQILKTYTKQGLTREQAVNKLDNELKTAGYDSIEDGWQVAVFYPNLINILSIDKI